MVHDGSLEWCAGLKKSAYLLPDGKGAESDEGLGAHVLQQCGNKWG